MKRNYLIYQVNHVIGLIKSDFFFFFCEKEIALNEIRVYKGMKFPKYLPVTDLQ